jgi:ribose 5-phosphate isomerase A
MSSSSADALKRAAAERAAALVGDGMRVGLGTGSTAAHLVALLGERVRAGLTLMAVPTSEATRRQAHAEGIPLTTLDETPELDITIDGADEIDGALRLIKGGGGALLREKIVAAASRRMIVIADGSKRVERLGRFPLPVEVVPFGLGATRRAVEAAFRRSGCPGDARVRTGPDGAPFVTDDGHFILDAGVGAIPDPEGLASSLAAIPGVVEHGLFLGLASGAILATEAGLHELGAV